MPVFPKIELFYKGKSNTQLVVSPGAVPADKWLPAKATNDVTQFEYAFGPEGNNEVVIPKGKVVAAAGVEYDVVTEKNVPRVKICDADDIPLGVAHHNVYKHKRDEFSGNNVNILTREYIRLPYFFSTATANTAGTAAAAIKWGAAWYESDSAGKNDVVGKYVVPDANGNLEVKEHAYFEDTDSVNKTMMQKVGQVYAVETDMPPAGYLQFFMGMVQSDYEDLKVLSGQAVPSPGRETGSGFGDIGQYPFSADSQSVSYQADKYTNAKVAFSNIIKGIPFLTDGRYRARAERSYSSDDFTDVWVQGAVTESSGKYVCNNTDGDAYIGSSISVKIADDFAADTLEAGETVANYPELNNLADNIAVFLVNDTATWEALDSAGRTSAISGGTAKQVAAADLHVDYNNNVLTVYLIEEIADDGANVRNELVVEAVTIQDAVAGTPTMWDYQGAVGEVRILLQK